MSRGWLLELKLEEAAEDGAKYAVLTEGLDFVENPLIRTPVGELEINIENNKYTFSPNSTWKENNNATTLLEYEKIKDKSGDELLEILEGNTSLWWVCQLHKCIIELCISEKYLKKVSKYQ